MFFFSNLFSYIFIHYFFFLLSFPIMSLFTTLCFSLFDFLSFPFLSTCLISSPSISLINHPILPIFFLSLSFYSPFLSYITFSFSFLLSLLLLPFLYLLIPFLTSLSFSYHHPVHPFPSLFLLFLSHSLHYIILSLFSCTYIFSLLFLLPQLPFIPSLTFPIHLSL